MYYISEQILPECLTATNKNSNYSWVDNSGRSHQLGSPPPKGAGLFNDNTVHFED